MAHNLNVTGSLSGSVSSSSVISGGTTSPNMSVTGTTITVTPSTTNTYITVPNTATPYTPGGLVNGSGSVAPGQFTFTPSSPGPVFTMPMASDSEIVAIRFDTPHGSIKICRDGRIEIPDSLSEDEGLAELWKNLEGMARRAILEEVRRTAAKALEKVLPDLLPDLHEYNKKLLPIAAAMAISIDDV